MSWVFDFHSDILSKLLEEPLDSFVSGRGVGPMRHYDLPRIEAGRTGALVCALFNENDRLEHPVVRTLRMIDLAQRLEVLTGGRVALARKAGEIEALAGEGRTALVLSIENGVACLDRIELLRAYYRLGVRAMGLVWNGRNAIADGCGEEAAGSRLTSFGREVVDEMNRLGMLVDVSHLSEAAFWDLLERTKRPVIASHSNARALCDHRRNLRDAQIAAIARSGGVVGVNAWPPFLKPGGSGATIETFADHVFALAERAGGIDFVGIGADFDGIGYGPAGLEDPAAYPRLAERLAARGLQDAEIEKVFHGNFLRVFREVCG
jgi:membrane dipeptidase